MQDSEPFEVTAPNGCVVDLSPLVTAGPDIQRNAMISREMEEGLAPSPVLMLGVRHGLQICPFPVR